jgi:hypothetical protein
VVSSLVASVPTIDEPPTTVGLPLTQLTFASDGSTRTLVSPDVASSIRRMSASADAREVSPTDADFGLESHTSS